MKEKETEVILVSGGRRVAGANSKFKKKSPEYLEKQLSWKVAPLKGIRIQESGKILQVESGILTEIHYLESGIHGVESRIQDCLRFPYMGRTERVSILQKIFI